MGRGGSRGGSAPQKKAWQLPPPPESLLFQLPLPLFSPPTPPDQPDHASTFALAVVLGPNFLPSFFLLRCAPSAKGRLGSLPSPLIPREGGEDVHEWLPLNVSQVPGLATGAGFLAPVPGPAAGAGFLAPAVEGQGRGEAWGKEGGGSEGEGVGQVVRDAGPPGDPEPGGPGRRAPHGPPSAGVGKKRRHADRGGAAQKRVRPSLGFGEPAGHVALGQLLEQAGAGSLALHPLAAALGLAVRMACLAVKQERLVSLLHKQGIPCSVHQALVEPWQAQGSLGTAPQQPQPLASTTLSFRLTSIPAAAGLGATGLPPGAQPRKPGVPSASAWHRVMVDLTPPTEQTWAVLLPVPWFRLMFQLSAEAGPSAPAASAGSHENVHTALGTPRAGVGSSLGLGAPPAACPGKPMQEWEGGLLYAEAEGLTGVLAWVQGVLSLTYPELSAASVAAMEADVLSLWAASAFISQLWARLGGRPEGPQAGRTASAGQSAGAAGPSGPHSGASTRSFLQGCWAQCRGRIRVEALGLLECRLAVDAGVLAGVPSGALRVIIRWSPRGAKAQGAPPQPRGCAPRVRMGAGSPPAGALSDLVSCSVAVAPADLWPHTGVRFRCPFCDAQPCILLLGDVLCFLLLGDVLCFFLSQGS